MRTLTWWLSYPIRYAKHAGGLADDTPARGLGFVVVDGKFGLALNEGCGGGGEDGDEGVHWDRG
jgi:hypothetical protein